MSYKKEKPIIHHPPFSRNCNSQNFKAIAQINFFTYLTFINNGLPPETYNLYLQNWENYEELARQAENNEVNAKCNSGWKNVRGDGKKMWELIDWNGKAESKKEPLIDESDIYSYFKEIFQSDLT